MTRVNCIPVTELSDEHLLAEWHELPRVVTMVENQIETHGTIKPVPSCYRMSVGHMQFFADKCAWIVLRMFALHKELVNRGVNADRQHAQSIFNRVSKLPQTITNNWTPNAGDLSVNLIRLIERDPEFYLKDVCEVA